MEKEEIKKKILRRYSDQFNTCLPFAKATTESYSKRGIAPLKGTVISLMAAGLIVKDTDFTDLSLITCFAFTLYETYDVEGEYPVKSENTMDILDIILSKRADSFLEDCSFTASEQVRTFIGMEFPFKQSFFISIMTAVYFAKYVGMSEDELVHLVIKIFRSTQSE